LEQLLQFASLGLHLTQPWQVVVAGPPNVGKSSLINAIMGFERTVVWDQPGTTRDVVAVQTAIDGWPVQLSDTAGLRVSDDILESLGVQQAWERIRTCDLVVLVVDATRHKAEEIRSLFELIPSSLLVINKCDLAEVEFDEEDHVVVSAITGQGMDHLLQSIQRRLIPKPPDAEQAMPWTEAASARVAAITSS
jgi:tRNA modification GTPase